MDGAGLAALVQVGEQLISSKLCNTATQFLWIYDYFLTLGDEITYVWNGRRSWVSWLFIANRYTPVLFILWSTVINHHFTKPLCQNTGWIAVAYPTTIAVLAQAAIALRMYAVTGKNKWIAGALSSLIFAQLIVGIYWTVLFATHPAPQLPEINLDPFQFCIIRRWKLGELLFANLAIAFDLLSFFTVLVVAKKSSHRRHPGVPSLLDAILRDATLYFMLIFLCQLLFDLLQSFAPASASVYPGLANLIFIPVMASRLILSLKKAAAEQANISALTTEDRSVHFASRACGRPHEVPGINTSPNLVEEDVELESMSRSSNADFHGAKKALPETPA